MGVRAALVVLMLGWITGCGGGSPTAQQPDGCGLGRDAIVTWSDIGDGAAAGTMTPEDLASSYGHLADRLGGVATLNRGTSFGDVAQAGADAAGRLRVGLITGDGYLDTDVDTTAQAVGEVAAQCV